MALPLALPLILGGGAALGAVGNIIGGRRQEKERKRLEKFQKEQQEEGDRQRRQQAFQRILRGGGPSFFQVQSPELPSGIKRGVFEKFIGPLGQTAAGLASGGAFDFLKGPSPGSVGAFSGNIRDVNRSRRGVI